jgi:hypothetical protein
MGADTNLDTETTPLLSGEQAVYRAPVTYKTFNMSWKGGASELQGIVDIHSGVYGNGPYYITDPFGAAQGSNLLPAKWASCHLLSHIVNGWGSPVLAAQTNTPERKQVTFTGNLDDADYCPQSIVVPIVPGKPLYFKAWGSRTGSASVAYQKYTASTDTWSASTAYVPTLTNDVPVTLVTQAQADAGDIQAVKIRLYLPGTDTLTLQHMDLFTEYLSAPEPTRTGKGIGPVQFTGNVGGKVDSVTIDRIGLSLDLCEVSRDPNN